MTSDPGDYVPNELLGRLVGLRLYSVQFVMDYVQLHFDGPTKDMPVLTCDALPQVEISQTVLTPGQLGYADALRSLIPQTVVGTEEETGRGLRVEFRDAAIVLHPHIDDVPGSEIALLGGFEDGRWMCWRPGEETFEHLA